MNSFQTKYHSPLLVGYLYVFFNTCLLPNGLYWTMLLFPLFLFNSLRVRIIKPYIFYLVLSSLFLIIHFLFLPIQPTDYLRSWLLTFLNIAFLINCWVYFNRISDQRLAALFQKICFLNFILVLIAVMAFFVPVLKPLFWYLIPITKGSGIVPRLKLFTSEASIYSLMLAPFFLYYFFYYLQQKRLLSGQLFFFLILPLLLSFSFGVIAGIFLAIILTILFYDRQLLEKRTINQIIFFSALIVLGLFVWVYIDKENLLVLRLKNIITGSDTSAKGRTIESFILAKNVLNQMDSWWIGIGPGQFKILGKELLLNYYQYSGNVSDIRIPNACADTLIVYGIFGLAIRIGLQVFLFFKTKVYKNYYRFSLFAFLFIYQFTGSYYNNLIEWTIWVFVFSQIFKQFDVNNRQTLNKG